MIYNVLTAVLKLIAASLAVGYALSAIDLSAYQVLAEVGLTPEELIEKTTAGAIWALPHVILGAMVIVPVWLIISLFSPPRRRE